MQNFKLCPLNKSASPNYIILIELLELVAESLPISQHNLFSNLRGELMMFFLRFFYILCTSFFGILHDGKSQTEFLGVKLLTKKAVSTHRKKNTANDHLNWFIKFASNDARRS